MIDCSHTLPGPLSLARKSPSPPNSLLRMPGTVVSSRLIPASNSATWPGCTRTYSPGASSTSVTSPCISTNALPLPREPLQDEARAAEDARAELLLHVHVQLDARLAADEPVAVHDVLVAPLTSTSRISPGAFAAKVTDPWPSAIV